MATATVSPSPPFTSLLFVPPKKSLFFSSSKSYNLTLPLPSTSIFRPIYLLRRKLERSSRESHQLWRVSAAAGDALPSETTIEKAQQIVPTTDDGSGFTIVSALLLIAFIGLSILTIGVIYLAVQDFLQKRERDKFEKEEAAKKKKGGKKAKVKAKTGPRGFGQKIEEEDD